jgi:uncharacterized protein (DUF1499 family)
VAALALLVCIVAIYWTRPASGRPGLALALVGTVLSTIAIAYPVRGAIKARSVPRIHDITTDTKNPPQFIALAAERRAAPNGIAYGGEPVAAEQRKSYRDIETLPFTVTPEQLFAIVERAARDAGWQIAASAPAEGRIEATATTRLYGFKDDVVIRITPSAGGSQLDVRSTSRLGVGDMGTNAARIRAFTGDVKRRAAAS